MQLVLGRGWLALVWGHGACLGPTWQSWLHEILLCSQQPRGGIKDSGPPRGGWCKVQPVMCHPSERPVLWLREVPISLLPGPSTGFAAMASEGKWKGAQSKAGSQLSRSWVGCPLWPLGAPVPSKSPRFETGQQPPGTLLGPGFSCWEILDGKAEREALLLGTQRPARECQMTHDGPLVFSLGS